MSLEEKLRKENLEEKQYKYKNQNHKSKKIQGMNLKIFGRYLSIVNLPISTFWKGYIPNRQTCHTYSNSEQ